MKKIIALIIILTLLLAACGKEKLEKNANDHFFLESEGAVMPVFVNGNTKSKIFVIYLHGGPGGSSLESYQNEISPFTKLQTDFAVVNWEQRCSGSSQGGCSNLTLAQYVTDLERLIYLLKNRYASDITLFLVGHSWGGTLGIKYLTSKNNQSLIKGWIEVGGGHNVPNIIALEREMVIEIGNRQIDQENNINEWQENISNANSLDLTKVENLYEMNKIAAKCEQLMQNVDSVHKKIENPYLKDYFFGPMDFQVSNINENLTFEAMKKELSTMDLSSDLINIKIPTLLIWGKYDFRVPPKFAQEEFSKYGSNQKELVIFNESAHFVHWNQPDQFYTVLKLFIETYK
jgi:pimeloyl-ACP methyl ester carboxylesterase